MPDTATPKEVVTFAPSDIGNATILRRLCGDQLRYLPERRLWRVWSGRHWADDTTGQAYALTFQVFRHRLLLADDMPTPALRRTELAAASAAGMHVRRKAMLASASTHHQIAARVADFDRDPFLLNCANGLLDLRTGELRPHDPAALCSKLAPVAYEPEATCPRWELFLREVFQEDQELIAFARRLAGYLLTGDTREQAAFFLVGKGANGKSVFVETLRALLGGYAADAPVSALVERAAAPTTTLASLPGTRLLTVGEVPASQTFDEPLLKRLTGGDPLTCRPAYHPDSFSYFPTFKLLFVLNDPPRLPSQSYALRRRLRVLPFRQTFYPLEEGRLPVREETLRHTLAQELPGLLAWAVRGCREWQQTGLQPPAAVAQETAALLESTDPLADFLAQECLRHPLAHVPTARLWQAYLRWCDRTHVPPAFRAPYWLTRHLVQREGIEPSRTKTERLLAGIGLRDDEATASLRLRAVTPKPSSARKPRAPREFAARPPMASSGVTPASLPQVASAPASVPQAASAPASVPPAASAPPHADRVRP